MKITAKASKLIGKTKTILFKHSPEIWVGAGIVAIVGGTIWACHASRKLDDILEAHEEEKELLEYQLDGMIDELGAPQDTDETKNYDAQVAVINKNYKKDCAKCTLHTGVEIAREYAPAVLLIGGGIGMIINGHHILCQRNAMLLAAYTALDQSFTDYRSRVATRFGKEVENDIYTGTTYIEETKTITGEDGKKKKVKEKAPVIGDSVSPYARIFDETTTREWQRSADANHLFLTCQQNSANDKLIRDGYLFLNTVYRMLGLSETPTGAICGWLLPTDSENGENSTDGYIDFGVFDGSNADLKYDEDGRILLDFNCQGVIYDKI